MTKGPRVAPGATLGLGATRVTNRGLDGHGWVPNTIHFRQSQPPIGVPGPAFRPSGIASRGRSGPFGGLGHSVYTNCEGHAHHRDRHPRDVEHACGGAVGGVADGAFVRALATGIRDIPVGSNTDSIGRTVIVPSLVAVPVDERADRRYQG